MAKDSKGDAHSEECEHKADSSLPVSIDDAPRLYRRSMAYSADNDRASVITIARAPRDSSWDSAAADTGLAEDAGRDTLERAGHPDLICGRQSSSDVEQPLLAEAHNINHDIHSEQGEEAGLSRKINFAMNISLVANVLLLVVKIYAFWFSKSKAILASAADSLVDIASQLVIAYAEYKVHKADPEFPIGRTRLETVGVVACAVIMTLSTLEVIQSAGADIWGGVHGYLPHIKMGILMYAILGAATGIKLLLYIYCFALRKTSDSMMALAEDHCNDILSNLTAIVCGVISSISTKKAWWVDPIGAILISAYIIWSWGMICKNQVDKIVGKGAPEDFIGKLEEVANAHHDDLEVDVIRAYFFGSRFVVEMEVVMPAAMTVKESHDIALVLQHKVEGFNEVERAFVHVDYEKRQEPEHKVERNLLRKSENLFESHDSLQSRGTLEHQSSSKSWGQCSVQCPESPPLVKSQHSS